MVMAQASALTRSSSDWLARQCGPLTSCCSMQSCSQLTPPIPVQFIVAQAPISQPIEQRSRIQQLQAVTAVSSPTSYGTIDFQDATAARLYMLYDFVKQHGRLPEQHEQHKSIAVGQWSEQCRLQHQNSQLEPLIAEALESVPGWSWKPRRKKLSAELEQNLATLQRYVQLNGRMPRLRNNPHSNFGPGEQMATAIVQRMYDLRKRGLITSQQMHMFETSLPGWRWDARVRAPPLDGMIQLLTVFSQQHGRLPKQNERYPDRFLIGEWCSLRRSEYNRGELHIDVADMIQENVPGWLWNPNDNAFEEGLEVLMKFVSKHHRMPTQREEFEGVRVGAWTNKRRLQYKSGVLPLDRVAALEAVEGWWWSAEDMPME